MKTLYLCQSCTKYYRFDDDLGEMLVEGCKLDLPHFHPRKAVECSSYTEVGGRFDY